MVENQLTQKIIGCAIEVHKILGPGLLESAYQRCLVYELEKAGLKVVEEKSMPIVYKDIELNHGYRMDILVEDKVVLELKTVESFSKAHFAQLLTYLRLGNYQLGLLMNFNVTKLTNGLKRIIN